MRNGYCATTIKTTAGPVTLQRPKVRGTTERVADRLFGKGVTKTNALESLVIAGFVRGLSVRDVEAALAEALGPQATVSKSTVSRICTQIKTQFEAFSQRRLDDVELDYLFLDGSRFKYHVGAAAEPVLAAWGIDTDGKLCGVCPLEASSGKTVRHQLNRGGNRDANRALHVILVVRLRRHQPTRDYLTRRLGQGKTKNEIMRCLKRYITRQIFSCPAAAQNNRPNRCLNIGASGIETGGRHGLPAALCGSYTGPTRFGHGLHPARTEAPKTTPTSMPIGMGRSPG